MATYREIHGKAVKSLSTDPSATTDAGQIWYNTSSNTFKSILNLQAWTSAASMINPNSYQSSSGTQTAGITSGGYQLPSSLNKSEDYNGSGWSANPNINTARGECGGAGPQTAALIVGGDRATPPLAYANTETFDGSSWSEQPDMNNARFGLGVAGEGTTTASLAFGGNPSPLLGKTEEYNGSAWSNQNDLNTPGAGMQGSGAGTQTAGLAFGRTPNGNSGATELYDGTNWTTSGAMNTSRDNAAGGGPQTAAYVAGGGGPSAVTTTETFDGTSWTTSPATLGSAAKGLSGTGNSSSALAMGNYPAANTTSEFNSSASAITAGAWSSAPSLNTSRAAVGRSGIAPSQTAALCVSGYPGPPSTIDVKNVEEFDGSSWTEVGDVNSQRDNGMCAGTTTAGLFFGGNSDVTPGTKPLPLSEEWDGSSWTAGNTMQNGNEAAGGFGTQTAAVQAGGSLNPYPNYTNTTEKYNGTSWSDVPATIFASVAGVTGVGTETAGLIFCGNETPPPGTNYSTAQTYNGTAFTTVNSCVETGNKLVGGGTQTAAFGAGGGPGSKSTVQHYDGTTWSTAPSLGTGRSASSGGAPQAAGIYFAGNPGGGGSTTATEQFTGETTAVNVKTLTQS